MKKYYFVFTYIPEGYLTPCTGSCFLEYKEHPTETDIRKLKNQLDEQLKCNNTLIINMFEVSNDG